MLTQKELRKFAGLPIDGSEEEIARIVVERIGCRQPQKAVTVAWINRVLENCRELPDDPGPLDRAIALMHVTEPSIEELDAGEEDLSADLGLERDAKGKVATFVNEAILPRLVAHGLVFLYGRDEDDFGSALPEAERDALWDQIRSERR
jgi:hypothetical protein